MRYVFYDSAEYKKNQSFGTRLSWLAGHHNHQRARLELRKCNNEKCQNHFKVKYFDPKKFCSSSCAASFNNGSRKHDIETRKRIALSLKGRPNKYKGMILVPRLVKFCQRCKSKFETERWQNHRYCSAACAIRETGSKTTSPRAARALAGIRLDVSPDIYFYSRWEANFARILNLLGTKWEFQYKTFDLKKQKYTPDFYLPVSDEYIEIKNFLSEYSKNRDQEFRELYPDTKLTLILKVDYLRLQEKSAPLIKNWEFS